MAKTFFARGSDGLVSIHAAGADYENPLSNLDKIYFHSSLDYLQVVQIFSGTLSLPSLSNGTVFDQLHNLGPHGLSYQPMVLGILSETGQVLCGDTMIFAGGFSNFRSLSAGSDSTNIYIRETAFLNLGGGPSSSAADLDYSIYVFGNPSL